ncbi:hypothetical protein EPN16_05970 [bacterium]|nr:MAG: hypothetical protein EPN16_05970 [bacterium]
MEKSEVYDYLAKIYLDKQPAVAATKGGNHNPGLWKKYLLILIIPAIAIPALYLLARPLKFSLTKTRSAYIATANEPIKIKFNFTDSQIKKQGEEIALSDLDVSNFKYLQLRLRRQKKYGALSLRVEAENSLKENASYYLTGLSNNWQDYNIALGEFKEITRWDTLSRVSFIVEEWNAENKEDCVYIDEIRFTQGEG